MFFLLEFWWASSGHLLNASNRREKCELGFVAGQQKKPSIPLGKGRELPALPPWLICPCEQIHLSHNGFSTGYNLLTFSCATPGRIHKGFYRLAPPVGSLEKTELVTTSHHRFICEIKHTLLHDVTFGKHLFTLEKHS